MLEKMYLENLNRNPSLAPKIAPAIRNQSKNDKSDKKEPRDIVIKPIAYKPPRVNRTVDVGIIDDIRTTE